MSFILIPLDTFQYFIFFTTGSLITKKYDYDLLAISYGGSGGLSVAERNRLRKKCAVVESEKPMAIHPTSAEVLVTMRQLPFRPKCI